MLLSNGVLVVDKAAVQRGKVSSPLLSTLRGIGGLKLIVDGSLGNVSPRDLVTGTPFTMTGGVGAWTEESNYRTMMGCRAPVVAGAVDNLLSDENASFEGGTVGGWMSLSDGTCTNISTDAWHGSKCLKTTAGASTYGGTVLSVWPYVQAGLQYTVSLRFKAAAGKTIEMGLSDLAGSWEGAAASLAGDGTWQSLSVTRTLRADATSARIIVRFYGTGAPGDYFCIDAIQLESGATANPFCLGSRTAASMSIANPLTAGATTWVFAVNTGWAGNDGVLHYLFDMGSVKCYKSAANNLTIEITDEAAGTKTLAGAVNATNWAANTNHVIAVGHDGAGTPFLKLDNTALTTAGGAGTGIPAAPDATIYLFTDKLGANPLNAPGLGSAYSRVLSAGEIAYLSRMTQWFPSLRAVY